MTTMQPYNRRSALAAIGGTIVASLAGCTGDDNGDSDGDGDDGDGGGDPVERANTFLSDNDANTYDGSLVDETGSDEVTIAVGGGDGTAFEPAGVRVDSGTTIVFEWTGEGGNHNVVPTGDTDFEDFGQSETIDEEGHTVEETFEETGVATYICEPHAAQGMYGAVVVE